MQPQRKRPIKLRTPNDGIRPLKNIRGKFVGRRKFRLWMESVKRYIEKDSAKKGIMRRYILGDK